MKKEMCFVLSILFALSLSSCSGEKTYTKEEWEAIQSNNLTERSLSTSVLNTDSSTTATTAPKKTTPKKKTVKNTTAIAPPTEKKTTVASTEKPTEAIITKPKLTDEIQNKIVDMIVQKHSSELNAIEVRHSTASEQLQKEAELFEVEYMVRRRKIDEQYANMGLTGSGAHMAAIRALDNQKSDIDNKIKAENDRYEKEREAFVLSLLPEIKQYIEENYDTK